MPRGASPRYIWLNEGLGGHIGKNTGHKDAVRIEFVVTEGAALLKTSTFVKSVSRAK